MIHSNYKRACEPESERKAQECGNLLFSSFKKMGLSERLKGKNSIKILKFFHSFLGNVLNISNIKY